MLCVANRRAPQKGPALTFRTGPFLALLRSVERQLHFDLVVAVDVVPSVKTKSVL